MAITTAEALRHMIDQQTRHLATLRLELGQASDLEGLTCEIRKLRSARTVMIGSEEVFADMSEPNWLSPEANQLFTALGNLRGVEEIQLQDLGITFGPQGPRFPVALLTRLLMGGQQQQQQHQRLAPTSTLLEQQQREDASSSSSSPPQRQTTTTTTTTTTATTTSRKRSLKRLILGVRLVGNVTEFQQFSMALRQQESLRRLSWEEWCFPMTDDPTSNDDDALTFDFNPIIKALATLPQLDSLSIKAMTAGSRRANLGSLEEETFVNLLSCRPRRGGRRRQSSSSSSSSASSISSCSSSRCCCPLRQLQLVHFQLDTKTIQAVANVLRNDTSSSLEFLSLDLSKTESRGANHLFDMLRYNTTITEFQIWASTQSSWAKDNCLIRLSKALQTNSTIQSLAVVTHSRTLVEAMSNLKVVNDAVARAFVQTLETNCTLESLVLDDYGEEQQQQSLTSIMMFYLALNCSKRRQQLLQKYDTYTRKDWMELLTMAIMSESEIQLEAVYYFLRLNPSLCQVP